MAEHTPTPWLYRPHRHDDWGWIRGQSDDENPVGPILVQAKSGLYETQEQLDVHRTNKTDPHAANALFVLKAVNNHDALLAFFQWAMREGPWDGGDLDGASIQDKAESLGLIVKTQYDAEKHGVQSDFEHGDDWFEYAPQLRADVGQVGSSGK